MRTRVTRWAAAVVAAGAVLTACGSAAEKGSDLADVIAERGIAAVAKGRWHCETDENDGGSKRRLTTDIAIGTDGRFSFTGGDTYGGVGTWSVDGLKLKVAIPWSGDGAHGFNDWVYDADANPPTEVRGTQTGTENGQQFNVTVHMDKVTLVQRDVAGPGGPNYDWTVTCTRTSRNPGTIPPTIPASGPD